jgi:nucleoside-diphosphate-sugar epimerase
MTTPILVTGGTSILGRLVVARLRDAEVGVRVLSRQGGPPEEGVEHVRGDLGTGEGIQAAVEGADVVVHCAGSRTGDGDDVRVLRVQARGRAGRH